MLHLPEEIQNFYSEIYKEFTREKSLRPGYFAGLSDEEYMAEIEKLVFAADTDYKAEELNQVIDLVYEKTRTPLGVLDRVLKDDDVYEIMVNGIDDVFVERIDGIHRIESRFESVEELEELIRGIAAGVHREVNEMTPILDARLDDGSRVNAVYKNIAASGPVLTIRKFAKRKITIEDMIENGTISREAASFLETAVTRGYNIFISGGTSTGKTTFLNALTDYIPKGSRVIIIEDSRELMVDSVENIVQLECRNANTAGKGEVSMNMLIRTSLRMRPDRIIVGEVRGKEVAEMLQAMNTGHDGSMSTGHGNSVTGMLRRLEAMYLMSAKIPIDAIRSQILEGIDLMVHLSRLSDGRRAVTEIDELIGYEGGEYQLNRIFSLDNVSMALKATGNRLKNRMKMEMNGGNVEARTLK
ncbi:MAG: ATPase, T2SS/T4P/T4SS family [Eubacteriales bacterium]|nr:ATPase, T2SS/T4P/T4SS family [Eubacteriales bacterium]